MPTTSYGVPVNYNEDCVCEKPKQIPLDEMLCFTLDTAREIEYQVNAISFKLFGEGTPPTDEPKPMSIYDFAAIEKAVLERTLGVVRDIKERLSANG